MQIASKGLKAGHFKIIDGKLPQWTNRLDQSSYERPSKNFPHPTPCSAFRQVVLSVRRYPLNSKMKRGTMRIKSLAQEQRKRLKNIQSFKTHELSSSAIKSLVLPSRRRSGLETLSKPRRRRQRGRSKTKNIMSRTIAMECRVRETEAYGRERIMSVAVNHAVSSN